MRITDLNGRSFIIAGITRETAKAIQCEYHDYYDIAPTAFTVEYIWLPKSASTVHQLRTGEMLVTVAPWLRRKLNGTTIPRDGWTSETNLADYIVA